MEITHNQKHASMEKVDKTTKMVLKAIEVGRMVMMTAFAAMFGVISLSALICSFSDLNIFNILGTIAGYALARVCWDLRKEE